MVKATANLCQVVPVLTPISFSFSLQYLMTKTAMHFHGRDLSHDGSGGGGGGAGGGGGHSVTSLNGAGSGGVGGGGGGGVGGREVKPHQCQQCLKAFSSNHQGRDSTSIGICKLEDL
jgi:hypothetical protein